MPLNSTYRCSSIVKTLPIHDIDHLPPPVWTRRELRESNGPQMSGCHWPTGWVGGSQRSKCISRHDVGYDFPGCLLVGGLYAPPCAYHATISAAELLECAWCPTLCILFCSSGCVVVLAGTFGASSVDFVFPLSLFVTERALEASGIVRHHTYHCPSEEELHRSSKSNVFCSRCRLCDLIR